MMEDIDLSGLSVMVGLPAGRDIPALTVKSLLGTFDLCRAVNVPAQLGMVIGSSVVQWARDEVIDLFLRSDANRLFWIDSDMVWEPEHFMRMLALSQRHDVVCATYPAKIDQPTFYVNRDESTVVTNRYGLMEIWGAGLGFTVITRPVIEQLADKADKIRDEVAGRDIASVFRIDTTNGKRRGEDMAFFSDIRELGYTVWLDTEIDLGHIGQKTYTGSIKDAQF
jgi:hypothetical protein